MQPQELTVINTNAAPLSVASTKGGIICRSLTITEMVAHLAAASAHLFSWLLDLPAA